MMHNDGLDAQLPQVDLYLKVTLLLPAFMKYIAFFISISVAIIIESFNTICSCSDWGES